jgi:hypothetical protein
VTPLNDLERLLAKPKLGPQDFPELFRLLRETELVFLLPYHPELEGAKMSVKNGGQLPPFVVWTSAEDGKRLPIFSSLDRAQEACKKTGAREGQYLLCDMPGRQLFDLLACQPNGIVINPATTLHALFMGLDGVKQVVGRGPGQIVPPVNQSFRVQLLTPAEYPTSLVQGLFQYLRGSTGVRAAWLGKDLARTQPGTGYLVVLLGECDQKKIHADMLIVGGAGLAKGDTVHVTFLDGNNAAAVPATQKFTPFYAAPDYNAPSPLGPG